MKLGYVIIAILYLILAGTKWDRTKSEPWIYVAVALTYAAMTGLIPWVNLD